MPNRAWGGLMRLSQASASCEEDGTLRAVLVGMLRRSAVECPEPFGARLPFPWVLALRIGMSPGTHHSSGELATPAAIPRLAGFLIPSERREASAALKAHCESA